jgi:predicted nucleic acid-binding protein
VDTSAWYAVSNQPDQHFTAAQNYFSTAVRRGARLMTSDYVLDETLTRLRYDYGHAGAMAFWESTQKARRGYALDIVRVTEATWDAAMEIFRQYADLKFSFTDCTSFVLARNYNVDEVFAFDEHFALFGLPVRPPSR